MIPDDDHDLVAIDSALADGWGDPDDPHAATWGGRA